mgnify:CR=1 FL=1
MFFGNFPRNVFCAFAVTLLARPKKLDVGDHSCFASPSCDEQVIVGREVVLTGFFGNLHRRFLIKSPCRASPRPLKQEYCDGWILHAPSAPTNKISSGDEIATPLASFQIWLDNHRRPEGSKFLRSIVPPLHTCSPSPPRDVNTPWSAASRARNCCTPFQN